MSVISKLKTLIEEGRGKAKRAAYEDVIIEEIEDYVKEEMFYELPTKEILKIIEKSEFDDVELLYELISRMSSSKGKESTLLLNVIKREEADFEECIKILSKFEHSQICQRTGELFTEENQLPEKDFEEEIEKLKKENQELRNKINEKKICFLPVTEKPSDFENNICTAAEEGKLTSVQYLIEQCHADAETKDGRGFTPINLASQNGHLDIVRYLYEKCHANVETKDTHSQYTPMNWASYEGHLDVVKYLHETCHADVEAGDSYGDTPINSASYGGQLEVVKYLYETCHANVEAIGQYGNTSLCWASKAGRFEVIEYLINTCHANIEIKNEDGDTPSSIASKYGYIETAKYIEACKFEQTLDSVSSTTYDYYEYDP